MTKCFEAIIRPRITTHKPDSQAFYLPLLRAILGLSMAAQDRTIFPPEQQLIKDLDASLAFFRHYDFEVLREEPHHLAELAWGVNRLYLWGQGTWH